MNCSQTLHCCDVSFPLEGGIEQQTIAMLKVGEGEGREAGPPIWELRTRSAEELIGLSHRGGQNYSFKKCIYHCLNV